MSAEPLQTVDCPSCGQVLEGQSLKPASRFEDCVRRCDDCGIGFSNARQNPTVIYRDFAMNVPIDFREGLAEVLAQALNIHNRPQKKTKFGFSTSEDAITWTIFSAVARSGRSAALWRELTGAAPDADHPPRLLLWGVPLEAGDDRAWGVRRSVEEVSDALGEDPRWRTEPDVIIDAGSEGIILVEVKYRSPNDYQAPDARFDRYLDTLCFNDPAAAKATGLYELIRNWRFGCELAQGRDLLLVNLTRRQHLQREQQRLSPLVSTLATSDHRRFTAVDWEGLVDRLHLADAPTMLRYLADHLG